MSTMRFFGGASAASATSGATSSAVIGWNAPGETLMTLPSTLALSV
jgi:hypothetical protein